MSGTRATEHVDQRRVAAVVGVRTGFEQRHGQWCRPARRSSSRRYRSRTSFQATTAAICRQSLNLYNPYARSQLPDHSAHQCGLRAERGLSELCGRLPGGTAESGWAAACGPQELRPVRHRGAFFPARGHEPQGQCWLAVPEDERLHRAVSTQPLTRSDGAAG